MSIIITSEYGRDTHCFLKPRAYRFDLCHPLSPATQPSHPYQDIISAEGVKPAGRTAARQLALARSSLSPWRSTTCCKRLPKLRQRPATSQLLLMSRTMPAIRFAKAFRVSSHGFAGFVCCSRVRIQAVATSCKRTSGMFAGWSDASSPVKGRTLAS